MVFQSYGYKCTATFYGSQCFNYIYNFIRDNDGK